MAEKKGDSGDLPPHAKRYLQKVLKEVNRHLRHRGPRGLAAPVRLTVNIIMNQGGESAPAKPPPGNPIVANFVSQVGIHAITNYLLPWLVKGEMPSGGEVNREISIIKEEVTELKGSREEMEKLKSEWEQLKRGSTEGFFQKIKVITDKMGLTGHR